MTFLRMCLGLVGGIIALDAMHDVIFGFAAPPNFPYDIILVLAWYWGWRALHWTFPVPKKASNGPAH